MIHSPKDEQALYNDLQSPDLADDLYRFVMFVYPWGEAGTPLEGHTGPRAWQKKILDEISDYVRSQQGRLALDLAPVLLRMATASGRGIGKSAMVSWLCHWMMTTRIGSTTLVSANSEPQLKSTTFAEIKKWFTMAVNAHWFELGALAITTAGWFETLIKKQLKIDTSYYYVQGRLWTEENPHAYAGPHSSVGMLLIFDEASGIPKSIWNVAEGYFSDLTPVRLWLAFSNPRVNSGGFYDCFHDRDDNGQPYWKLNQIDSRTVEGIDHAHFDRQIREHGVDSDHTRVEVLGQFPEQGANQFISNSLVDAAQERELILDPGSPLIMGVDVARQGDDYTVVRFRHGPDARTIAPVKWKVPDLYVTADRVAALIQEHNPDAVCIDFGMGAGVIDILKRKGFRKIHTVMFGGAAEAREWADKRTEMYARLKEWLRGGCLDKDKLIFGDLTAAGYQPWGKGKDQIKLEAKESFKSRLGRSPDDGDALALTFAVNVARRDMRTSSGGRSRARIADGVDYKLFG